MVSKVMFVTLNFLLFFFFIYRNGFTEYSMVRIVLCLFIYIALYFIDKKYFKKVGSKFT